jgi:ABC-2 type transport system ATP-binding protein
MSDAIIQTDGLTKTYSKGVKALDALTLTVQQGEIFGYLGPNGAGKTTTIKLLLDLIRPTTGRASIFGMDTVRDSLAIRGRIGFLPGELHLWEDQTAAEIVRYFGRVRGGVDMNYVRSVAERLQFDLNKRIRAYSTGNKRKIGLIIAMMHRPKLLILDEPTSGLDPLMQQTFNQLMIEARAAGQTVFLSSHVLTEVQAICDRVGIVRAGVLQTVERVSQLTQVDFRWVTFRLREPVSAPTLTRVPGVSDVAVEGQTLKLRLHGDFDPVLRALGERYIESIHVQDPTLEEVFLTYYGGNGAKNHMAKGEVQS